MANDITVTLGGDASKLKKTIDDTGKTIGSLKNAIIGIGIGATLTNIWNKMDDIGDAAARMNVSTDFVQTLQRAGQLGGASLESLQEAFSKFQINLATNKADKALTELGFNLAEIKGMGSEEAFLKVAESLVGVSDYGQRGALAVALMGKSAKDSMSSIEQLTEANKALKISAEELAVIGEVQDTIEGAISATEKTVGKSMANIINYFEGIKSWISGEGFDKPFEERQKKLLDALNKKDASNIQKQKQVKVEAQADIDEKSFKDQLGKAKEAFDLWKDNFKWKMEKIEIPVGIDNPDLGDMQSRGLYSAGVQRLMFAPQAPMQIGKLVGSGSESAMVDFMQTENSISQDQLTVLRRIENKIGGGGDDFTVQE